MLILTRTDKDLFFIECEDFKAEVLTRYNERNGFFMDVKATDGKTKITNNKKICFIYDIGIHKETSIIAVLEEGDGFSTVRIGIEAPRRFQILREKVYEKKFGKKYMRQFF